MMIFQMYDDNGRHIAYDRAEAKRNEEVGYRTVTKAQFYDIKRYPTVDSLDNPVPDNSVDEPDSGLEDLKQEYFMKLGKRPHHAMKAEGLRKAINGNS